jgi:hypothetical protein
MRRIAGRSSLRYLPSRLLPSVVGLLLASVIFPSPALAFIPHWDPREAFFIRQFSYLFFMVAMIFFIYELKQEKLQQHRGFRLLAWGSVFFALWNLDCFIGQIIALYFKAQVAEGGPGGLSQRLHMANLGNWINYFTKLDHLFLVPAFLYFYRGIRAFRREVEVGQR